jgi:dTDP-4-dehydrorhamnose reductase
MKILLLGANGYLGSYLHGNLSVPHDTYQKTLHYDYIINCIGRPDVDWCELNNDESYFSNYKIIENLTITSKAKIINFSSYYVYDDLGQCTELAKTTNAYNYMKHKLQAERIVTTYNGVSFRVGKLFGHHDISKQNKLTEYIIKNNALVLDEINFNPTSLKQVHKIVEHELKHNCFKGVYNLANAGIATHVDYGIFISNLLDNSKEISIIERSKRSFHNYGKFCMSTNKISNLVTLTPWQDDLTEYIRDIKCYL